MTAYTPNFSDTRVINRCRHALGFVLGVMPSENSDAKAWSTRYIDKYLGQSQTSLSKYLRQTLLTCVSDRYNKDTGECKTYTRNEAGIGYVKYKLGLTKTHQKLAAPGYMGEIDRQLVTEFVIRAHRTEIDTGDFEYKQVNHRLFNDIQNVKSCYRSDIMAQQGYNWDYDIQTCAPVLLLQLSRQCGNDLWLPHMADYISNPQSVRAQVAADFEITPKAAKSLINSLFCGAVIGMSKKFATSAMLDQDPDKIMLAKQHDIICGLRSEIKTMWSYIVDSGLWITRRRKLESGRLCPVTCRDRWMVYFRLECLVIKSCRDYLASKSIRHLLEHDGFRCDHEIDVSDLSSYVFNSSGYDVIFQGGKV